MGLEMPTIQLHIERMKETIFQAFMAHSAELDSYVKHALDEICTESYLQQLVTEEVAKLVPEIVKTTLGDYTIKRHIADMVRKQIISKEEPNG